MSRHRSHRNARTSSPAVALAVVVFLFAAACGGEVARNADRISAQGGLDLEAAGSGAAGENGSGGLDLSPGSAGTTGGRSSTGGGPTEQAPSGGSGASAAAGGGGGAGATPGASGPAPSTDLSRSNEPGITDTSILFCSVLPLTGPLGFIGKPQVNAIDSYLKMVNENGGIHGRQILWRYYDDGFDPARGVAQTKKCVEEDRAWAMGPGWNAFTVSAAIPYLEEQKTPWFFSDGATTDQYKTGVIFPYGVLCDRLSQDITDRVITDRGAERLGIIYINNDIGQLCLQASQQVADALGVEIVETAAVNADEADYTPILLRMRSSNVDHIIIHGAPTETVKTLQAGERQGYRPPKGYSCSGGCAIDLTLEFIGRFSDGLLSNSPLREARKIPEGRRMIETVQRYHPDETDFGVFTIAGWSYARMLTDALQAAGPDLTRQKLAETLRSRTWENGFGQPAGFNPPAPGSVFLPLVAEDQHWQEAGGFRDVAENYPGIAVQG